MDTLSITFQLVCHGANRWSKLNTTACKFVCLCLPGWPCVFHVIGPLQKAHSSHACTRATQTTLLVQVASFSISTFAWHETLIKSATGGFLRAYMLATLYILCHPVHQTDLPTRPRLSFFPGATETKNQPQESTALLRG